MDQSYKYKGKIIEEMDREELVEAVKTLGILYSEMLKDHIHEYELLRSLRD